MSSQTAGRQGKSPWLTSFTLPEQQNRVSCAFTPSVMTRERGCGPLLPSALPGVGQGGGPTTHRVAVSNAEDRDHFAGIAHGEEGAIVGKCQVGHGALGLQELALVLQRGAQDGVEADIPVLREDRGAVGHSPDMGARAHRQHMHSPRPTHPPNTLPMPFLLEGGA